MGYIPGRKETADGRFFQVHIVWNFDLRFLSENITLLKFCDGKSIDIHVCAVIQPVYCLCCSQRRSVFIGELISHPSWDAICKAAKRNMLDVQIMQACPISLKSGAKSLFMSEKNLLHTVIEVSCSETQPISFLLSQAGGKNLMTWKSSLVSNAPGVTVKENTY